MHALALSLSLLAYAPPATGGASLGPAAEAQGLEGPNVPSEASGELAVAPPEERDQVAAKELFDQGLQAFEQQRFEEAIKFYAEGYRLSARPTFLINIALAEQQRYLLEHDISMLVRARSRYQEFLRQVPDDPDRDKIIEQLTKIQVLIDAELVQEPSAPPSRLMVTSPIEGAQGSVDGESPVALPIYQDVEPGEHEVRISAPGYQDQVERMRVPEGESVQHRAELEALPASLTIDGPPAAEVHVDGEPRGELPMPPLVLAAGVHTVAVVKNGYSLFAVEVELERDETRVLDVTMYVSPRRKTAWGLMGVGAAGVVAGGTLALLALRDQNDALDLDAQRTDGGISETDWAPYAGLRARRNNLRTAAVVTGVVGVSAIAASSLLLGLDTPRIDAMTNYVPEQRRRRQGKDPVALSWRITGAAGELRGRF